MSSALLLSLLLFQPILSNTSSTFHHLVDQAGDCHRYRYVIDIPSDGEFQYEISRIVVAGMRYDGPEGYNAFSIYRMKKQGLSIPSEVLAVMVKGQFIVFGADPAVGRVYAYRLKQIGAGVRISNIAVISPGNAPIKDLDPPSDDLGYIYGKASPDGLHCLLIGKGAFIVDLSGSTKPIQLPIGEEIPYDAADPPTSDTYLLGGDFNLSEKYLKVNWLSNDAGEIVLAKPGNNEVRKIEFRLPSGEK
jgi:hypothetical protein